MLKRPFDITVSFISCEVYGTIHRPFVSFICHYLTETYVKELIWELLLRSRVLRLKYLTLEASTQIQRLKQRFRRKNPTTLCGLYGKPASLKFPRISIRQEGFNPPGPSTIFVWNSQVLSEKKIVL